MESSQIYPILTAFFITGTLIDITLLAKIGIMSQFWNITPMATYTILLSLLGVGHFSLTNTMMASNQNSYIITYQNWPIPHVASI